MENLDEEKGGSSEAIELGEEMREFAQAAREYILELQLRDSRHQSPDGSREQPPAVLS